MRILNEKKNTQKARAHTHTQRQWRKMREKGMIKTTPPFVPFGERVWISTHYYLYLVDNCDWFTHQNRTPKHCSQRLYSSRSLSHCRCSTAFFSVSFVFQLWRHAHFWANCKQKRKKKKKPHTQNITRNDHVHHWYAYIERFTDGCQCDCEYSNYN